MVSMTTERIYINMSSLHSSVVFNNSCISVPVDTLTKFPSPSYGRWSCKVDSESRLNSDIYRDMTRVSGKRSSKSSNKRHSLTQSCQELKSVESFLHFYENIPDINDLSHLSDEEFYATIKRLKDVQKKFSSSEDVGYVYSQDMLDGAEILSVETSYNDSVDSSLFKKDVVGLENTNKLCTPESRRNASYSGYKKENESSQQLDFGNSVIDEKDTVHDTDFFKKKKDSINKQYCRTAGNRNNPIMYSNISSYKTKPPPKCRIEKASSSTHSTSDLDSNKSFDKTINESQKNRNTIQITHNGHNIDHISNLDSCASSLVNLWDKTGINSEFNKGIEEDVDSLNDSNIMRHKISHSLPGSPLLRHKTFCKTNLTIPKPFKMTLKESDEEQQKQSHFHMHGHTSCLNSISSPERKRIIKAHPVPLQSRVPLYDKIMEERELRRRKIHRRYSKELRSSVRPFSFTKRDEAVQRWRLTCSNPDLSTSRSPCAQFTFRAKPVPSCLFSNHTYERMREDEFYRALKKRVRAEEMLKSSCLPPSMAARERSVQSKNMSSKNDGRRKFNKNVHNKEELAVREYKFPNNISKSANYQSVRNKSSWFPLSPKKLVRRHSTPDSSTEPSPYESTPEPDIRNNTRSHSSLSVNKNNLASLLRFQTTRKRMEMELNNQIEENHIKEEARFKARLVRMTPSWRALNYSTEEDLAMRVAARREEERLRRDEHRQLMESIYGRVHLIPPLFERQTKTVNSGQKFDKKETCKEISLSCDNQKNNFELESQISKTFFNDQIRSGNNNQQSSCSKKSEAQSCMSGRDRNVSKYRSKSVCLESNHKVNFEERDYSSTDEERTEVETDEELDGKFYNGMNEST